MWKEWSHIWQQFFFFQSWLHILKDFTLSAQNKAVPASGCRLGNNGQQYIDLETPMLVAESAFLARLCICTHTHTCGHQQYVWMEGIQMTPKTILSGARDQDCAMSTLQSPHNGRSCPGHLLQCLQTNSNHSSTHF